MDPEKSKKIDNNPDSGPKEMHRDFYEVTKKNIKGYAKESIRELKKGIEAPTIEARKGLDMPSFRHEAFGKKFEEKINAMLKPLLKELDDLFAGYDSSQDYAEFLDRVKKLDEKSKSDMTKLQQAVFYSVKCLAGYNNKIEPEDYAYFYTVLDNVSNIYSKETKIVEILADIKKENITDADWDAICRNIQPGSFKRERSSSGDELKLSTSAFFIQLMTAEQRTLLLLEFKKRQGAKNAAELADQMVCNNLITLKQYEFAMKEIKGGEYVLSPKDEDLIRESRRQAEMVMSKIDAHLKGPLAINAAERVLNRKTLLAAVVAGIGVLGMVSNFLVGLKEGKGIGKVLNAFTNPYFLGAGAVTAGGTHKLLEYAHPGKSVGPLDSIIPKPKSMENLFGTDKMAKKQEEQMMFLSTKCANYPIIEDWLLKDGGFDDITRFYQPRDYKERHSQYLKLEEKPDEGGEQKSLYDEFIEDMEKNGKENGIKKLEEAKRKYGKRNVEEMIFDITVAAHTLGITSTKNFNEMTTTSNINYRKIFFHYQGLAPRPTPEAKNK